MDLARAVSLWAVMCAGCAHLPDATLQYYLPQASVSFKVQRSIACDAAENLVVSDAVTPTVQHTADTSVAYKLPYARLNSVFADSDVKFDFYDDGRLKGINTTLTGQGETILKTAVSIAASAAASAATLRASDAKTTCAYIRKIAGDKPIVLGYEGKVDLSRPIGFEHAMAPDDQARIYEAQLPLVVSRLCARVLGSTRPHMPLVNHNVDGVLLTARQPGLVDVGMSRGKPGAATCAGDEIWRGKLVVAQAGVDYALPIPKAPMFGKQVFVAAFAESGALGSVQYVSNTGAGQALNVIDSASTSLGGAARRRADELNAEADAIVAQQRLAVCRADPKSCK